MATSQGSLKLTQYMCDVVLTSLIGWNVSTFSFVNYPGARSIAFEMRSTKKFSASSFSFS